MQRADPTGEGRNGGQNQSRTRVLVGASSFADAQAALRIAARLVDDMIADLGGLLIEETTTLAAFALPGQRVVSASGAVIVAPAPSQMQTLLRAEAQAFRSLLARIAAPNNAGWSFERQTGDLIECAIRSGQRWDVLIVGHRGTNPVPGKVLFLGSASQDRALRLADSLSRQLGATRDQFVIAGPDSLGSNIPAETFETLAAALSRLARTNAQAVVIDLRGGPIRSLDQLRALLAVARCPVVVLGASSVTPMLGHGTLIPPA